MSSNKKSSSKSISERVLRSRTGSSISFENSSDGESHRHSRSNKTSTPILGRKITKSNLRRTNSAKSSSNRAKPKKKVMLLDESDDNQSTNGNEEMNLSTPSQPTTTTTLNINTDLSLEALSINENQPNKDPADETNQLNDSMETIDENYSTSKTTTATKTDVMNFFEKQVGGGFKCTLCKNSYKVNSIHIRFLYLDVFLIFN